MSNVGLDEEWDAMNKMKLDYEEIRPCSDAEVRPVWEEFLEADSPPATRLDRYKLEEAVKAGMYLPDE